MGILTNPESEKKESQKSKQIKSIKEKWLKSLKSGFNESNFRLNNENPIIDNNGLLLFKWPQNINNLDFLIATVIQPKPNTKDNIYPTPDIIAEAIYKANCYNYFIKNIESGIRTFQDAEIVNLLQNKYDLRSYLKKNSIDEKVQAANKA